MELLPPPTSLTPTTPPILLSLPTRAPELLLVHAYQYNLHTASIPTSQLSVLARQIESSLYGALFKSIPVAPRQYRRVPWTDIFTKTGGLRKEIPQLVHLTALLDP